MACCFQGFRRWHFSVELAAASASNRPPSNCLLKSCCACVLDTSSINFLIVRVCSAIGGRVASQTRRTFVGQWKMPGVFEDLLHGQCIFAYLSASEGVSACDLSDVRDETSLPVHRLLQQSAIKHASRKGSQG